MRFPQEPLFFPLIMLLFQAALSIPAAADTPDADRRTMAQRRIEREKTFLLRSADELNRTLASANETMAVLKEQTEAAAIQGPGSRADERLALLVWYQKYSDWLKGMSQEMDLAVSEYFSRQRRDVAWTAQCEELTRGCRKLADELDGSVQRLEKDRKVIEARMQRLNAAVTDRRILVDRDDLDLARELWPSYRPSSDRREAVYRDLSEEEVLYFRNEQRAAVEQLKYLDCLTELGTYERGWLAIKAGDFAAAGEIAAVIGGSDPGAVAYAIRSAIRTYESDIAILKGRSGEIDAKIRGMARTGSLGTLDRLEELSRYYEKMKNRFDRQVEWLRGQIGSYRAELMVLDKERLE
jgi:hypothetical protein